MEPSKPSPSPEQESPLMEALRKQLQTIVEKPLTPRTLVELEQTARLSRELLIVGKMPEARRTGYPGASAMLTPMYLGDTATYEAQNPLGPYVTSPQSETFGVSVVRELVTKLPELMKAKEAGPRETAASLIDAITAAREAKMDDVVEKLKAKLDALLDEPKPPPLMAGPGGAVHVHAEPLVGSGMAKVGTESGDIMVVEGKSLLNGTIKADPAAQGATS